MLCNNYDDNGKYLGYQSVIVMQDHNYYAFDVYSHYIGWNQAKTIWIGFHKNEANDKCLIAKLPKDIIKYIIKIVGVVGIPKTAARAIFV